MYDHDHARIVIATARNAAGSHPENLQVMINMDSSSAAPPRNDDLSCAFCDENHPSAQVLPVAFPSMLYKVPLMCINVIKAVIIIALGAS